MNAINLSFFHFTFIENLNVNIDMRLTQGIKKEDLKLQRKLADAIDLLKSSPDLNQHPRHQTDVYNYFNCYCQINKRVFFITASQGGQAAPKPDINCIVDIKSKRCFKVENGKAIEMRRY